MLIEVNPENPQERLIKKVVETLGRGGVIAISHRHLLWYWV